ncbi:MAG: metallophosphoesterase family protein [Candidatus Hadarchaeota archaeon]|nr:metallophosphoesterase family protein [Candidatus Hadarchaeota archaeon]
MRPYDSKGKLAIIRANFEGEVIVAGDLHGDLEAFERVRDLFLQTPSSLLIFLGDYADRGSHGLEVIEGVKELMEKFEGRVVALKGNHEDYRDGTPSFTPCDLPSEVEAKKGMRWSDFFPRFEREFLSRLHLAALVPGLMLLVHGGISSKLKGRGDLESPPANVEEDILWSDPYEGRGEHPNPRGAGVLFGPETSKTLLRRIGVKYLVRSHQPRKAFDGPCVEHSGRVFTLSSTRVYGGTAFVLVFKPDPALTPVGLRRSAKNLLELHSSNFTSF